MSRFYNPKVEKVSIIVEGSSNQLYSQGLRSFKQYEEICKYFAERKQKDANTNLVQKHLQLHDVSFGEYVTDNYALWLEFKTIDKDTLHGMVRKIGNLGGGREITLHIEKKAETAGVLKACMCLSVDAQLNIEEEAFHSIDY